MGVYFNPHDTVKKDSLHKPMAVLQWILRNVPCFIGKIPADWTDGAIFALGKQNVPLAIVIEAFTMARSLKYDWYQTALVRSFKLPAYMPPTPSVTQQDPMTPEYAGRVAALMEQKYILAVKTDDYATQASILVAFRSLLQRVLIGLATAEEPEPIKQREEAGRQLRREQTGRRIRTVAPTVNADAEKLERMGVRNPTSQVVRTQIAPTRSSNQGPKRPK